MIALDSNVILRLVTRDDGGVFADQLIVDCARAHGCDRLATFDSVLQKRHPGFAVEPT